MEYFMGGRGMKKKNNSAKTVLILFLMTGILFFIVGCEIGSAYLDSIEKKIVEDLAGAKSFTVTYFGNNNTSGSVPVDSTTYYQGDTVEVLENTGALERTNYTFDGWNTQEDGEGTRRDPGDTFLMGTANVELHAIWTINTPTVTFMPEDGSTPTPETKQVTYGETYGSLATTSRTGYSFDGWYDAASGGNEITSASTVMKNYDHNLYAYWTARTYTLSFDVGDGGSIPPDQSVTYNSSYGSLPSSSRWGYDFEGWWSESGGTGTRIWTSTTVTTASDHSIYAKWSPNDYTITFDKNDAGAEGYTAPMTMTMDVGGNLHLCGYTKEGWNFKGWTGSENSSEVTRLDGAYYVMEAGMDFTLYALWEPESSTFSIGDRGPAGGWIFYDYGGLHPDGGWRYLEAAPVDQNDNYRWGTMGFDVPGVNTDAYGWGFSMTRNILDYDPTYVGHRAADDCDDYSIRGNGSYFDDWYLPAMDSLEAMYTNLKAQGKGDFADFEYWSSTESDTYFARCVNFSNGSTAGGTKSSNYNVRPVRRF
jgi:uncharacterized repeat protein (TIGR02543 family)